MVEELQLKDVQQEVLLARPGRSGDAVVAARALIGDRANGNRALKREYHA